MSPPATPHELREAFIRFFEERDHRRVPGAPIVPPGDPTLLFTSAGMVQFKPYFTGQAEPPARRLASVQKCFRTSDIESVGDTSHLTFFEMLGNFSVGDYFKAEIVPWAWEFVTERLQLPAERLHAAVYLDDDEAYDLWVKVGVSEDRIWRYGDEENYWFSGDVGPCGPCSEIYYDFGEQFGCGPECQPNHDCGRFLEIWNLVFMTYYCDGQKRDPLPQKNIDTGSGFERVMSVLLHNSPGWDKAKLPSCYDTPVFHPIVQRIEALSGKKYGADDAIDRAMRIVAEHSRAVTILVGDERTPVVPSNEERGYVCRRMLRRAVYFGRRALGIEQPFMTDLASVVIDAMKDSYPELERQRSFIEGIIGPEEQRFDRNLRRGWEMLEQGLFPAHGEVLAIVRRTTAEIRRAISARSTSDVDWIERSEAAFQEMEKALETLKMDPRWSGLTENLALLVYHAAGWMVGALEVWLYTAQSSGGAELLLEGLQQVEARSLRLSGDELFLLHDTYGFPVDLTRDIAKQHGFTVDEDGFAKAMEEQRGRGRASAGGADHVAAETFYANLVHEATLFTGYGETETATEVVALATHDARAADEVAAGADVEVFLVATPFYPEGGGQVGDRGTIAGPNGVVEVSETQRVAEKLIVHRGRVREGKIAAGDAVTATVDPGHRSNTKRNHTATHLLHAALRQVLGTHVRQAGSLVAPGHLRFDFTHTEALTPEQLAHVESLVNEKVRQDIAVHTKETSFDEAMKDGVLAFFGDKYGERVRVVEVNTVVPQFSAELCGGTHCEHTGQIGAIVITAESSIGSGMRRLEALTGEGAEKYIREQAGTLAEVAQKLGAPKSALIPKLESVLEERDALRKKVEKLERSLASGGGAAQDLTASAQSVDGVAVIATRVDAPSVDALRFLGDGLRKQLGSGVAVLGTIIDDKPMFIALVSGDLTSRGLHAGNILKRVAKVAGGNAGGRPDMAQGGGKDAAKLDEALGIVPDAVREMLAG